ncbi:MAG: DNA-3-methyladenine glycosylase family protein [Acidimicrobiales bacterium]
MTDAERLELALAELRALDPVLDGLVIAHGTPTLGAAGVVDDADGHFAALVRSVLYQQLAGKAAAAIHGRVQAAAGGSVTPAAMLAIGHDGLRGLGLSGSKAATILDLAQVIEARELDLAKVALLADDEVVSALSAQRGIGPWTAQMFSMFRLGRLDVWPVGDYGVRKGYAIAWGLEAPPTPKELGPLGEPYRPWRSVVAWYCWRAVEGPLPGW